MHSTRTENLRALVLGCLDKIQADGTADSIESAKDRVIDLMREKEGLIKHWLDEFDAMIPGRTKGRTRGQIKNDVFERIRNTLDNWSLPTGPYPEIAEAFSTFSKKKNGSRPCSVAQRTTPEDMAVEEAEYYLRLISYLEDGYIHIVKLSREDSA